MRILRVRGFYGVNGQIYHKTQKRRKTDVNGVNNIFHFIRVYCIPIILKTGIIILFVIILYVIIIHVIKTPYITPDMITPDMITIVIITPDIFYPPYHKITPVISNNKFSLNLNYPPTFTNSAKPKFPQTFAKPTYKTFFANFTNPYFC